MSHSTPSGNGCSLEDCYTNLFSLTEIRGIKWRKLSANPDYTTVDQLEDPVLVSYSKCIKADILSVWRRVARSSDQPRYTTDQLSYNKELWIFWYGDEPENLSRLISPDLRVDSSGGWDNGECGISYECRTLIFKALHNLIEKCLLHRGFVRIGKWFVQPHDVNANGPEKSTHLSFCFNFFLHGESSVCASIEVKQHPPVWRLTNNHLSTAQENPGNLQVILVPYGLCGSLTGNSYRETDQSASKIIEEWSQFYPLDKNDGTDVNKIPPLVEVIVAGVRMKYPSCYVLLCEIEDAPTRAPNLTAQRPGVAPGGGLLTPPTSPAAAVLLSGADAGGKVQCAPYTGAHTDANTELMAKSSRAFSARITEKVTQDNLVTAGIAKRSMETISDEAAVGVWNFNDPSVKTTCNCARHRGAKNKLGQQNKSVVPLVGKKGDKPDKLERQQSRLSRGSLPFHRRHIVVEDATQNDMPLVLSGSTAPFNSAPGNSLLPQLNNSTETNGGTVASVEAASPADMSPMTGPQSPPDPAMPKLSPHPPVDAGTDNKTAKLITEAPPQTNPASEFIKPTTASTPKVADNILSPLSWPGQQSEAKTASINNWIKTSQPHPEVPGIKRPVLPAKDTDEDELVTKFLYDYQSIHSWSEYPVKRARVERSSSVVEIGPESPSLSLNHQSQKHKTKQPDPYDFIDDEQSINPATVSKRMFRSSRDEYINNKKMDDEKMDFGDPFTEIPDSASSPPETPSGTKHLIHTSDLKPSYDDLAHIFDSDDSDKDDPEHFGNLGQTMDKYEDGTTKFPLNNAMTVTDGAISVSELSKMYPTPPSNNTSNDRSPGPHDVMDNHISLEKQVIKTEFIHAIKEDFFRDLPAVFEPAGQAEFMGSDKYSPIVLQSSKLSPLPRPPDYKGHWQFSSFEKPVPPSYTNIPSIENIPSMSSRMPSSAVENSPATFLSNSVGQQRTPLSNYNELQSPASNASSYLNKTLNSIDNQGTNHQIPEVHSLVVNVFLMDSRLNLFRDVNFDSCNICVCNMNIKGADTEIYLSDSSAESATRCVCGFSAIVNRRFGHNSGLFYEDEVDITGIKNDRYEGRKPSLLALEYQKDKVSEYADWPHEILNLLVSQFSIPYPSASTIQHLLRLGMMNTTSGFTEDSSSLLDILQLQDGNDITYMALDLGRQAMEHCSPNKLDDPNHKSTCLHKWQFLQGASRIPQNSQDCVQVLKSLQPILQDAIQNKRSIPLWEHKYKLSGPLTWKEFHQLAGRGSDENSTPQPIPSFLAGLDGDWVSLSPYSLRYWDKQFLEPYGKPRDIAYIVLAPDNDYIINAIILFFKELSNVYELSRMGRHSPVSLKLRDGIMRVGKKIAEKFSTEDHPDDWFKFIGNSNVASKLRLYSQVCRSFLAPLLAQQNLDQSVFEPMSNNRPGYKPAETKPEVNQSEHNAFTMPAPQPHTAEDKENVETPGNARDSLYLDAEQTTSQECPALMVYLIDSFTYGSDWDPSVERLTKVGLLKCYNQLVKSLPETLQQNISLQIIPLSTILETMEKGFNMQTLQSICFSVFSMCRWNLAHSILGRHLTGFGPAAAAEIFLRKKEADKAGSIKLHGPPFVLAPTKDTQTILAESCGDKLERSFVLFCAYCMSEDQRYLLAACTDEQGEMMETCSINIEIPNRSRRKKASARKIGLQKLWDFLLGVVSMSSVPCRLIIGRFGRIGHGEMKGWSGLLSKKNLELAGKKMKQMCGQCSLTIGNCDTPGILSACLVSLESLTSFNIMADAVKMEEKMSSNCPLQTPRDASTTHILVFPTSAIAQANSHAPVMEISGTITMEDTMPMDDLVDSGEQGNNLYSILDQECLLEVFDEITTNYPDQGNALGNISNPGSPTGDSAPHNTHSMNGQFQKNATSNDPQDEMPNLLNQPLALGYFISTASPGPLPRWFWSASPEKEFQCPSCFKAALHIHSSSKHDEFSYTHHKNSHPLDSNLTPDVLRYVLETYNALSWLTFDPVQNDRQSCLPIHFMVLMQMYHALNAFV